MVTLSTAFCLRATRAASMSSTLTSGGTRSLMGAKFRIALTPERTRRSVTDWAAAPGVVMTATVMFFSSTTRGSSSRW